VLRVYGWNPAAISVGYNQDVSKEINLDNCKNNNIDVVRRISGGKAVFHDKELTYSFILPESLGLLSKDINESYKEIADALLIAFEKLGISAEVKKVPERIATSICFNSSNWYELLVNRKKISGSAQRRMAGKILQHGSMLIDFDYEKNSLLFNSSNLIDVLSNLRKRITSLKNELNKVISYEEFAEAIKSGFKENFGFEILDDSLSEEEKILAQKLREEKYKTDEWNYKLTAKTI
ncbi:MAG: biotin/lipoate A/B protein ligase family protein, partial [Candidatus Woesearchaeota archaeon]